MEKPTAARVLRVLGITLGSLVVLVVLLLLAVWLFVNPNKYKGRIEQAMQQSTGRRLALSGDIRLSVFPSIALQLGPASLSNPPGFGDEPFASLQRLSLKVRLLPLLHKQLQIGRVEVDGLDLRLNTDAQGRGNWELTAGAPGSAASTPPAGAAAASTGTTELPEMAGLVIKNSRFSYQDEVADHIDLNVGRIAPGASVPVRFKLDLVRSPGANPIALAGKLDLSLGSDAYRATGIDLQLDSTSLRGEAAVSRSASAAVSFDMALDRIDLDRYLGTGGPSPKRPSPSPSAAPTELPTDTLKTLRLNGSLTIGSAHIEGVTVSQVHVVLASSNGVIHMAPATAQLYGGSYSGDITLDARGATPVVKLEQNISDVEVQPLLKDFMHTDRLSGRGNLTTTVTAEGKNSDALIASSNGRVTANLVNGAVMGADLWFEVHRALAVFQRQPSPGGSDRGETKFNTFRASADVARGIATTKDLTISSQDLRLTGAGTANLVTQAINYRLQVAVVKGAATAGTTAGALVTVPVNVTGTLSNFKVRPDVGALAEENLQRLNNAQLPQKIPSLLKGLLKGRSTPPK